MHFNWEREHLVAKGEYQSLYLLRPLEYGQTKCHWVVVSEPDSNPIRWFLMDGSAYSHLVHVFGMKQDEAHRCIVKAVNWMMEASFLLPPSAKDSCDVSGACGQ